MMVGKQEKRNYSNNFFKKVQQIIAKTLEIEIDKVTGEIKITWKKKQIRKWYQREKGMVEVMAGRTKCRTICRANGKWGR